MARRKRKTRSAAGGRKRRRRRSNPSTAGNRRRSRPRIARRARRRGVRRNPPLNARGILNRIMQGVQDAGVIVAGEAVANIGASYIPVFLKEKKVGADGAEVEVETQIGLTVRKLLAAAGVAVGASIVFARQRDVQRMAVGGALSSLIKSVVRPMLPKTGPFAGALSAGGRIIRLNAYPGNGLRGGMTSLRAYQQSGALRGYPTRRLGAGVIPSPEYTYRP